MIAYISLVELTNEGKETREGGGRNGNYRKTLTGRERARKRRETLENERYIIYIDERDRPSERISEPETR